MSEVSVRSRLSGPTSSSHAPLRASERFTERIGEQETDNEYRAFSFGRAGKRTLSMLSFKKRDGSVEVFCYADMRRISSPDPERQLLIRFVDAVVVIQGQNLQELLGYVKAWRCDEIVESRNIAGLTDTDEKVVVEKIVYKQR